MRQTLAEVSLTASFSSRARSTRWSGAAPATNSGTVSPSEYKGPPLRCLIPSFPNRHPSFSSVLARQRWRQRRDAGRSSDRFNKLAPNEGRRPVPSLTLTPAFLLPGSRLQLGPEPQQIQVYLR